MDRLQTTLQQSTTGGRVANRRGCRWRAPRLTLLAGLLLLGVVPNAFANDWLYTVRPGDQLWKLAQNYCGTHTRWSDLAAHNQLADPNHLRPGTRLRFPLAWLTSGPAAVELVYVKGDVRLVRAAATSDTGAAATGAQAAEAIEGVAGAQLTTGDRLLTGLLSFATVRFADESRLRLGPSSEVVFDALTSYGDTGMVDTRVRIVRGGAESSVSPQVGPGAVYRIGTPLGVAAVRGTKFRTRAEENTSFIEMTDGKVRFDSSTGDKVDVEQGEGLVASPTGAAVEALLTAPSFVSPAPEVSGRRPLEWQPLASAIAYVVSVVNAADPSQTVAEERTTQLMYRPSGLAPGTYQIRVRGVASSGLEGLEATHQAKVALALGAPQNIQATRLPVGRDLLVTWDPVADATAYEVSLRSPAGDTTRYTTSAGSAEIPLGVAGDYELEVVALAANARSEASTPANYLLKRFWFWPR